VIGICCILILLNLIVEIILIIKPKLCGKKKGNVNQVHPEEDKELKEQEAGSGQRKLD
jgi:hypothetical protein